MKKSNNKYVILLRHGERVDRVGLPITFHPKDPEMTDNGKNQAFEAGKKIKYYIEENIGDLNQINIHIISSPFTRTLQTSVQLRNSLFENDKNKQIILKNYLSEYIDHEFEGIHPNNIIGIYINHPKFKPEFPDELFDTSLLDELPNEYETEEDMINRMSNVVNVRVNNIFRQNDCDVVIMVSHATPIDHMNRAMGYPGPYGWEYLSFCDSLIYSYDINMNKFEFLKKLSL